MRHPRIAEPMPTESFPAVFQHVEDPPLEPAPVMGEHSRAVLSRVLAMPDDEIDALIAAGVVEQWTQAPAEIV
jgi:crotonobetainyl-CoA:carnitine CoA-transferase CaiB-like acyl-CoA transferase